MRVPNRETAIVFFRYYFLLGAVFLVIYGGTNYLTSVRIDLYRLYFAWELSAPFVPGFVYIYLSILLLFLLPLFTLNEHQIRALAGSVLAATVIAGVIFLLIPAEPPFERPTTVVGHEFVFGWLYALELPYNLFPSLHVSYAALFIGVAAREERSMLVRLALAVWLVLLIVSVVLVRQHQVIDIAGGIILATLCYRVVYARILN